MAKKRDLLKEIESLDPVDREALIHNLFELYEYRDGPFLPFRWYLRRHVISEFPGIVQTPGVCGGVARVIRTRIPVWTLEQMRQLGIPEVEILRSYPSLRAVDLVQAWSYADQHREEIEKQIRENEEE